MAAKSEWTIEDVRQFLSKKKGDEVSLASARTWARRHAEVVEKRPSDDGRVLFNVYDPEQVREAYESMPGRGGPGKSRPSRRKSTEDTPC